MAKCFSKKYETRNEIELLAIRKLCQDACQCLMYIPISLPQEQADKTNIVSVVNI